MSYAMMKAVKGTHLGLLIQITGKRLSQQSDRAWETLESEEVLQATGTQLASKYKGHQKYAVVQWVDLRPLLEIYGWGTGYRGGGRKRQPLLRQGPTKEELRNNIE